MVRIIKHRSTGARRVFVMDGIYADEIENAIKVVQTLSPRYVGMDYREIVSALIEMGMTVERCRCEKS